MAIVLPPSPAFSDTSDNLFGGLDLSIMRPDREDMEQDEEQPRKTCDPFSFPAAGRDFAPQSMDLGSKPRFSPALPLPKGTLPVVLEESEFPSAKEGSSISDTSSFTSSFSISSSSTSSTRAFFRKGAKSIHAVLKAPKASKPPSRSDKKVSFMSRLMWPLKRLRDGYMSCMMGFEGVGDLSALAQGSYFASPGGYFADEPMSKRDALNHG